MLRELNEQDIRDIIVCEPVTSKGISALNRLGLTTEVSIANFYEQMCVPSAYHKNELYYQTYDMGDSFLFYPYSVDEERFNERKLHLELFDKKLISDVPHESPLIMYGTRGSGKSIEVNRKIRHPNKGEMPITSNYVLYDLEDSCETLTYGETFYIPDSTNVLWLFFMSLLREFYNLIEMHKAELSRIEKNHKLYFSNNNSANEDEIKLFSCIGEYNSENRSKVINLFNAIDNLINKSDAIVSIKRIMKITINFMYCFNPASKNYIVFDNIEDYINLNYLQIPIPEDKIVVLYQCLTSVIKDNLYIYNRIKPNEFWRAFKVILACRRVTRQFLITRLHFAEKIHEIGNDYSGCIDIWRIWEKKKKYIWEALLKSKFNPEQYTSVIWILDDIMSDIPQKRKGTVYQKLVLPMMNMGIRRNAHTQAHAVMSVWNIISKKQTNLYIDYSTFQTLLQHVDTNRYLYRRALIELHLKWMITSSDSCERFSRLLLGELSSDTRNSYKKDMAGFYIKIRDVKRNGASPFVQRILSYLSNHINGKNNSFQSLSLYELMQKLFLHPDKNTTNSSISFDEHFLPLATILTSLGNMEYQETKGGAMVILEVHDTRYHQSANPNSALAAILKEIWDSGEAESYDTGRYNCINYSVRLTEAGEVFVNDVKPSFSFFAALYCSEEVPLFFLKDVERIKNVIEKVYESAEILCSEYELAARNFCGPHSTLRQNGLNYLLRKGDNFITFRHRVKELHKNHLEHYKNFIENNASTLEFTNANILIDEETGFISEYIKKYQNWTVDKECF